MKRINYSHEIQESLEELQSLEREQKVARLRDYVRFFRYLKSGEAPDQKTSGALIGLQLRQSQNLWRSYRQKGLAYLLQEHRGGSVGYLSYYQISQLRRFLRQSTIALTQEQIADWIQTSFGVRFTQGGISALFQRLKIKLKTGRPQHSEQQAGAVADFKKTLKAK